MNRITHFDIYADDPNRAEDFYSEVFGWKFEKWQGEGMNYWLVMTGDPKEPGIDGGMALREGMWKDMSSRWSLTIEVKNIDEIASKIESSGGEIVMKKMALSKVGWFAGFKDPEGNILSLMQTDRSI